MALFGGGETTVEVALLDQAPRLPGDVVEVSVRVGEVDGKVQGGRIELRYENTYREEYRDSDGDRSTRTTTSDVVVDSFPLFGEGAAAAGEYLHALTLPLDGPPTARGAVDWSVRAVVDRRRARDATAELPLEVLAPAELHATWADGPPAGSSELSAKWDVATRVIRPGETLSGSVTVLPTTEIQVRSSRLQLRRSHVGDGASEGRVEPQVPLGGEGVLPAGQPITFPVQLLLPFGAPPSFSARHSVQHWYLELVLDRRLRGDITSELEVVVATA